ncbi:hypothetical protein Tco_1483459 [Tanacetum coccineum]
MVEICPLVCEEKLDENNCTKPMVEEERWHTVAVEGGVDQSVVEATVVVGSGTGIDRSARVVMVVEVVVVVVLDRSTVTGNVG